MGHKQGQIVATIALLAILLSAAISGCGNKKVLSFFFDGVPAETDSTADTLILDPDRHTAALTAQLRRERADSIAAANRFILHAPYADGDCDGCHNMETRSNSGSSLPSLGSNPAAGSGWLIAPVEELCITCHDDMSADYAEENELSIHAPVAEGMCVTCHSPHRSRNEHLLLTKTARELCLQCHDESIPTGEDEHPELEEDDDCTMCHNPHLSVDELFLE